MSLETTISTMGDRLMRAVVRSGVVRPTHANDDCDVATRVMREEMKAFLTDRKYADERSIVQTGCDRMSQLAFASLTAECLRRIIAERGN